MFSILRIMIKRPLDTRFSDKVREGRKFTTIRKKPWPVGHPIMLYHWSGKPYRSKHIDVAAIEVDAVLGMMVAHNAGGGIVFGRENIDGLPIYESEGFDDPEQMREWFLNVVPVGQRVELSLMKFHLLNANVDLPDTAAQDSASKSNSPAVSG